MVKVRYGSRKSFVPIHLSRQIELDEPREVVDRQDVYLEEPGRVLPSTTRINLEEPSQVTQPNQD